MGFIAKPFIKGTATIGTWFGVPKSSVGNLGKNVFGVTNQWGAVEGQKRANALAAQEAALAPPSSDADGTAAADRARRLAQRAQGQASTIRSQGTAATLYSSAPKSLLGS